MAKYTESHSQLMRARRNEAWESVQNALLALKATHEFQALRDAYRAWWDARADDARVRSGLSDAVKYRIELEHRQEKALSDVLYDAMAREHREGEEHE